MTIVKTLTFTTAPKPAFPGRADEALNDFATAFSGSKEGTPRNGVLFYGRNIFFIKNSIYLSFGPLQIPRTATITDVSLQFTSIDTTGTGATLTAECWLFLLKSDGVWDSSQTDRFGAPGAYLLGKPTVDFSISTRVGTLANKVRFGTSVLTPEPPSNVTTSTLATGENGIVSVGQTFLCDETRVLQTSDHLGIKLSKTAAGGEGRLYWYELHEVTPDAADGQPVPLQGSGAYLARTDAFDLGFAPAGSPVWGDLNFQAGTSATITAGKWYVVTLRYDWEGIDTGTQLQYETIGNSIGGTEAANNGGTFYGMCRNWFSTAVGLEPDAPLDQFGFSRTGYPTTGHFTEMSTPLDVPAQFTGKNFGTRIGPFTALADVDETNLITEGFTEDTPTATVTGLISNIQAWVEDFDEYDPESIGRNLTLVLDESGALVLGAGDSDAHRVYGAPQIDTALLPTLKIRYELPGGGEAMRYRSFTVTALVGSRGITVESTVRSRGIIVES